MYSYYHHFIYACGAMINTILLKGKDYTCSLTFYYKTGSLFKAKASLMKQVTSAAESGVLCYVIKLTYVN